MQLSQVDFSAIAFSPFVATKGVKTSQAILNGAPVEFLLDEEFHPAPFGASAFNDPQATRLTLEVDITQSPILEAINLAEQAIIKKAHAMGIFEGSFEDAVKSFKSWLDVEIVLAGDIAHRLVHFGANLEHLQLHLPRMLASAMLNFP